MLVFFMVWVELYIPPVSGDHFNHENEWVISEWSWRFIQEWYPSKLCREPPYFVMEISSLRTTWTCLVWVIVIASCDVFCCWLVFCPWDSLVIPHADRTQWVIIFPSLCYFTTTWLAVYRDLSCTRWSQWVISHCIPIVNHTDTAPGW